MESQLSEIVLSKEERAALIAAKASPLPEKEEYKRMYYENLLHYSVHAYNGNPGYTITERGKAYLLYREEVERIRKQEDLRYWITTGIAILALILSVISLLL